MHLRVVVSSDADGRVGVVDRPFLARYIIETILGQMTQEITAVPGTNHYLVTLPDPRYLEKGHTLRNLDQVDMATPGLGRIRVSVED